MSCTTCGSRTCCAGRVPLPRDGWVCRAAVAAGLVPGPEDERHLDLTRPGWSRGVVIHCPREGCRNVAYAIAPAGFPWRRCARCDHMWNPEAAAA